MDKGLTKIIQGIHDREARAANSALESIASVFKELDSDVMTRSEIVDTIEEFRKILNEELNINRP